MTKTQTTASKPRRMAREPHEAGEATEANSAIAETSTNQDVAALPIEAAQPIESKRQSKQDLAIELLRRKDGALLTDLVEATGWLPHTTRAALTGLKKKGHKIEAAKVDKVTRYSIASE